VILPTFRNPSKAPKSYQGFDKSPCPLILYDDHWCNCKQQPHIANHIETSLLMLVFDVLLALLASHRHTCFHHLLAFRSFENLPIFWNPSDLSKYFQPFLILITF
jgi:hypothetical protein